MERKPERAIHRSDFSFARANGGGYYVTYTSPVTFKCWATHETDMALIEAVKETDSPRLCDMEELRRRCKKR